MMDLVLQAWVAASSSQAAVLDAGPRQCLETRQKLKLLFAGYNGTRNMGSDVRVEEMLRQSAARPGRG